MLLKGIGVGVGIALTLSAIAGVGFWYHSRPKPPRPWNSTSIKAEFDRLGTEGDKNTFIVEYVLENTTNFDYRLSNGDSFHINASLKEEKSLAESGDVTLELPLFVPAKTRARILIHLPYPYTGQAKQPTDNAEIEQWRTYRKALEDFVNKNMGNLDGFSIFDEGRRYEIRLPKGW